MKQKEEKQRRVRKEYAPDGERGQKAMSFRIDLDNVKWLNQQPNKGRYVNNLIASDRETKKRK